MTKFVRYLSASSSAVYVGSYITHLVPLVGLGLAKLSGRTLTRNAWRKPVRLKTFDYLNDNTDEMARANSNVITCLTGSTDFEFPTEDYRLSYPQKVTPIFKDMLGT